MSIQDCSIDDVLKLPCVNLRNYKKLPHCSGVYFAVNELDRIQYIGKANNLWKRWTNGHHKAIDLSLENKDIRIFYMECPLLKLSSMEAFFIGTFQPPLNFASFALSENRTIQPEFGEVTGTPVNKLTSSELSNVASLFELNDDKNIVASAWIRYLCGEPHNNSWARYRKLLELPCRAKDLTVRQAYLLWVCAHVHRFQNLRKLSKLDLYQLAEKSFEQGESKTILQLIGGFPVRGTDLPEIIRVAVGVRVSERSLYRWSTDGKTRGVPKYERDRFYKPLQIQMWIKSANLRYPKEKTRKTAMKLKAKNTKI